MIISSSAFTENGAIPEPYTGLGPNINPPLTFSEVPRGTKSLVLIFEDLDAQPKPWTHWLLFNISPDVHHIDENSIPEIATEGYANGGTPGYEGPNPVYFSGTHHYRFTLYALDAVLDLPITADRSQVEPAMKDHIIAQASLVGLQDGTA